MLIVNKAVIIMCTMQENVISVNHGSTKDVSIYTQPNNTILNCKVCGACCSNNRY